MVHKILTVVGARPQFIKAATVSRVLQKQASLAETIVHTGQHFDASMSEIFFTDLKIPQPKYNLNINGGTHAEMTGRMRIAIEEILLKEKPDAVLVYGDTNSTLAAAMAAAKLGVPVVHVEAGLRSYNQSMPEETNRVMTDQVSTLLFCPTKLAVEQLAREGITKGVHHTGDVMYDAMLFAVDHLAAHENKYENKNLLGEVKDKFAVMTLHREATTESFETLAKMISYVSECALKENLQIIFPTHPRLKPMLSRMKDKWPNVFLTEPLGYFEMHWLLKRASLVFTDSGGLQKEAYFHSVPCVTLRGETEWPETIKSGWNRLWQNTAFLSPRCEINDFGDGHAAEKIVRLIGDFLSRS